MTEKRYIQSFKVTDERGNPIDRAKITLVSDAEGEEIIHVKEDGLWNRRVTPGNEYTAKAEKEGYGCTDCKKTFTTPHRGVIHLTLKRQ